MTNAAFTAFPEGLMDGSIDLDTAVIKAAFIRGYTFSAADKFMSTVLGTGTLNGTPVALTSVTVTGGVLDAADSSITTTASAINHAIILSQASAVTGGADVATSAQRTIAFIDTGTGLPIQPGTGATPITWDNGANKILKIG
jgi:hypothetical protein